MKTFLFKYNRIVRGFLRDASDIKKLYIYFKQAGETLLEFEDKKK